MTYVNHAEKPSLSPHESASLGYLIGQCDGTDYVLGLNGIEVYDENHSRTPLQEYLDEFADITDSPRVEISGSARENFVAQFVSSVAVRNAFDTPMDQKKRQTPNSLTLIERLERERYALFMRRAR